MYQIGNGHNIGTDNYTLNGKDDIIGVYTINSTTGELTLHRRKVWNIRTYRIGEYWK